jgi:hypothetical protein
MKNGNEKLSAGNEKRGILPAASSKRMRKKIGKAISCGKRH